jgi:hypothetical protein
METGGNSNLISKALTKFMRSKRFANQRKEESIYLEGKKVPRFFWRK